MYKSGGKEYVSRFFFSMRMGYPNLVLMLDGDAEIITKDYLSFRYLWIKVLEHGVYDLFGSPYGWHGMNCVLNSRYNAVFMKAMGRFGGYGHCSC